jgi:hypothetical protein
MLSLLNVDERPLRMLMGVLDGYWRRQNTSMKVRVEADNLAGQGVILDPDQFVVTGIVIIRKIDIVFPEEVVSN